MPVPTIRVARLAGLALLLALGLAACGRRGPLEAPGGAVATPTPRTAGGPAVEGQPNPPGRAQVDDADSEQEALLASPVPAPPRGNGRRRGFTRPTTPFPLDAIL
jgi:predicted small lipoprotein YifL